MKLAPLVATLGLLLGCEAAAWASPLCMTVDEFNAYMDGSADRVTTLSLRFDVTGVDPASFFNSKGCLAELDDDTCTVGSGYAAADVKVYGTADPPNSSHPPGTIKMEYGSECCAAPPCSEGWASPNPSATVFVDGNEQCDVHVWLNPAEYGYSIDCGGAVHDAVGDNTDDLGVTQLAILQRIDGGWAMPNASSSWNEVCFEPPVVEPGQNTISLPVLEDVTVQASSPTTTYLDESDLSVEAGDSECYLKFDLSGIPGLVTSAQLFLHLSDTPSADGSGGDAYLAGSSLWSETTLTWNERPPTVGTALARVAPATSYQWYSWDVSAAVAAPAIYSFAIVPESADTNGAHFLSKEASASLAPYLRVEYVVIDDDSDGYPNGPDCDDGDAAVNPGAGELCNGKDDDCDGATDEGCSGGAGGNGSGGGGPVAPGPEGDPASVSTGADDDSDGVFGACSCRAAGSPTNRAGVVLLLALVAAARRRRRARARTARSDMTAPPRRQALPNPRRGCGCGAQRH